ncbi:MAG: serine hydrolase [Pseudomonadota bacterium]
MKIVLPMVAGLAALALTSPAAAQSAQERLDGRYDQALAAGYKALFLCSAIANAEANGVERTPESVHEWELNGIQRPLDGMIREMEYEIVRRPTGQIAHVEVTWAEDMPARVAAYYGPRTGCSIWPIGAPIELSNAQAPVEMPVKEEPEILGTFTLSGTSDPDFKPKRRPIDLVFDAALEGSYGEGSRTTVVLVRAGDGTFLDGKVLKETARFAPGFSENTPQRTWSVAKSIASTFVGMAVHSGEYAVSDPVGLTYWRSAGALDGRGTITIDHALRMATGRYSDTPGNRTDPIYWGGSTVDEKMTNWPLINAPGSVYRYANNDTLLAMKAVELYLDYQTPRRLLAKIGMTNTVVETDYRGNYVLSSQVWSTASDLANLGQLYLQNGVWEGERLLPENWRDYVSDPSGPQPQGTQWGYGAGWWTFRRPEGNAFEGIPNDAFAARGNRGQYVVVVPSRNVVIVRRGEDMVGTRFDIAAFTRDVLAALDEE